MCQPQAFEGEKISEPQSTFQNARVARAARAAAFFRWVFGTASSAVLQCLPRSPARSSHARSRAAAAQDAPGIQDKNHSRGATQEASAGGSSRSETSHELRFVQSCGIFHLLCINTRMAEIKNRQVQTLGVWLLTHPVELTPHQPRH